MNGIKYNLIKYCEFIARTVCIVTGSLPVADNADTTRSFR